jgi:hypothetical protein
LPSTPSTNTKTTTVPPSLYYYYYSGSENSGAHCISGCGCVVDLISIVIELIVIIVIIVSIGGGERCTSPLTAIE